MRRAAGTLWAVGRAREERWAEAGRGRRGVRRALTVDSRTWLWKCCSRADTSSCPSILLHARRLAARALRRTIAYRLEGLDGRPAGRDGSGRAVDRYTDGDHNPGCCHSRRLNHRLRKSRSVGRGLAPRGPGRGGGRGVTSEEGAARQRREPRAPGGGGVRPGAGPGGWDLGPRPSREPANSRLEPREELAVGVGSRGSAS